MAMIDTSIPPEWKEQWQRILEQLHDPLKLQVTTLAIVAAAGLGLVYKPMSDHITSLRAELKASQSRLALVRKIEAMRTTKKLLVADLPPKGDANFWTEYMLEGVREAGVKLRNFEARPKSKLRVGHYTGLELKMEVEGDYAQIHSLISWVEHNEWFMRILEVRFEKKPLWIYAKLNIALLAQKDSSK